MKQQKANTLFRLILSTMLVVVLVPSACKATGKNIKDTPKNQETVASKATVQGLLDGIKKRYSSYKSFKANFTIKGEVEGRKIRYAGIIRSYTNRKKEKVLKIELRDEFVGFNWFELIVEGNKVIQKNHQKEQIDRSTLDKYRWVQVFGQAFPFKFFLPLLRGFAPEQIYLKDAKVGNDRIVYKGPYYDMSVKLNGDLITSLFYRSKMNKHITTVRFVGQSKNKLKRYFPSYLLVTQNTSEDHLKLTFSRLRMR